VLYHMTSDQVGKRARGRSGRRRDSKAQAPVFIQRPFTNLRRPYPAVEVISNDQVETIHEASLKCSPKLVWMFVRRRSHHNENGGS